MFFNQFEDAFDDYCKRNGIHNFLNDYKNHIIPECVPKDIISSHIYISRPQEDLLVFYLRDLVIKNSGFLLVDQETCKSIYDFLKGKKVLEVMSGTGCLAYGLKQLGLDIIPTDIMYDDYLTYDNLWCDVEKLDCLEALDKYNDCDIILVSWPRPEAPMKKLLRKARKYGKKILYLGETVGGCCASSDFFEMANIIDYPKVTVKHWQGIYDTCALIK